MRIVSLSPAVTEILVRLGLEDEVAGVTPYCSTWLRSRKEVVGTYISIDISKLRKLNPDIVFLQSHVHDKLVEPLKGLGFKVYLVQLPTSIHGILQNVIEVGIIVGRYVEARELVEHLFSKLINLARNLSLEPKIRPRVYIEYLWPDWTYVTAGALTYVDDGIWWAGGINIFHDVTGKFFTPRDSEISIRKPDLVIVNLGHGMKIDVNEYISKRRYAMNINRDLVIMVRSGELIDFAHMGPSFVNTIIWLSQILSRRIH